MGNHARASANRPGLLRVRDAVMTIITLHVNVACEAGLEAGRSPRGARGAVRAAARSVSLADAMMTCSGAHGSALFPNSRPLAPIYFPEDTSLPRLPAG